MQMHGCVYSAATAVTLSGVRVAAWKIRGFPGETAGENGEALPLRRTLPFVPGVEKIPGKFCEQPVASSNVVC
jgi:hypothetical protein